MIGSFAPSSKIKLGWEQLDASVILRADFLENMLIKYTVCNSYTYSNNW